jgi:hypothetical protein
VFSGGLAVDVVLECDERPYRRLEPVRGLFVNVQHTRE